MRPFRTISTLLLLSALRVAGVSQDIERVLPDLEWRTLETDHFLVHYHRGTERTALEVARIAERIHGPITSLYGHEPDQKVSWIIRDHDDISNGAAYFYDNRIEILAPAMDFEFRGIHPWLENVVTHEFTHIVQIQTSMKLGRRVPALYFQWLGYESERRPDVLYGFPNVVVSYPLSAFIVPSWFAEGTAQVNHPDLSYDFWDSHRDMILRMHMVDGTVLSWEEMAVFGKTSLGNESSYNAGFSIVAYIAETYGTESLAGISRGLSPLFRLTIDGAIRKVLGKSGRELYDEWKKFKTTGYLRLAQERGASAFDGKLLEAEGFGNFYPRFSPDGSVIAFVSNKGKDYLGQSSIYEFDRKTRTLQKRMDGVRSTVSFSPDGKFLYYAKSTRQNPSWSRFYDLYRFDRSTGRETRLTKGLRALNPALSPDGNHLTFAFGSDGTLNLGISDSEGRNIRKVTDFVDGEQVFTPVWSPDGKTIAFGYSNGHGQSIALIDTSGANFRILVGDHDARNPRFSHDGSLLYYAHDRDGIFNIYAMDLTQGSVRRMTNVLGGAFLPDVNPEGDLVYAAYTSTGYKIALVEAGEREILASTFHTETDDSNRRPSTGFPVANSPGKSGGEEGSAAQNGPALQNSRPYRNVFTSLSIIPVVRVDNYNPRNKGIDIVKLGLYGVSSDVL
ncbi:MAG: biopolymer transporter Tol, partial [Bacteroidota bacterium]